MFSYRQFKKYVERFFRELPKIAFVSSIFGFVFFWVYLKNISMLDVFMKMDISVYGLVCVSIFFMLFFIVILLPFYSIEIFFSDRDCINLGNDFIYSITQSMMMLLLLIGLFSIDFNSYFYSARFIIVIFWLLFFSLLMASVSIYMDSNISSRVEVVSFIKRYFLSGFLLFPILLFVGKISVNDNEFFLFITLYFLLLIFNDFLTIKNFKSREVRYWMLAARVMCVFFIIIVSVNGFKMQRLILTSSGMAHNPEQAGWYLVKDKDILDSFKFHYSIKFYKNIAGVENYYVNGYLILNIGNVRVICPHDFEMADAKHYKGQKLDFSKCLNLTSEDIKFIGKKAPFEL